MYICGHCKQNRLCNRLKSTGIFQRRGGFDPKLSPELPVSVLIRYTEKGLCFLPPETSCVGLGVPLPHVQSTNPYCLYWRLWLVYLVTFPKNSAGDRVVHCSNYEFQCFLKGNFCVNSFDYFLFLSCKAKIGG